MSFNSLHDVLQAVSRYLPDVFISSRNWNRGLAFTRKLPAHMAPRMFGFEIPLDRKPEPADFAICITQPGCDILAGTWPSARESELLDDPEIWRNIKSFCTIWGDPETTLFTAVKNLWLEFRLKNDDSVPTPIPFIGTGDEEIADDLLIEALELLNGERIPGPVKNTLLTVLSKLPGHVRLFQAGVYRTNGNCTVRLCLEGETAAGLPLFLESIGFPGSCPEGSRNLRYDFKDIPSLADRICIHLDIGSRPGSTVGIELRQSRTRDLSLETQTEWDKVLGCLEDSGLCLPENRDFLKNFAGSTYELLFPDLLQFVTFRFLYYLKAVFAPGTPPRVKAYFGFVNREFIHPPEVIKKLSSEPHAPSAGSVLRAVQRGSAFLVQNQLPHGEFRTYIANDEGLVNIRLDGSPFTTAFVLWCTRNLSGDRIDLMRRKAYGFLLRERYHGYVWKYWTRESGKTIAPDLDDTCCVSVVLRDLFGNREIESNIGTILSNRDENGLFMTWIKERGESNDVDAAVNANVLLYLGEREENGEAVRYIKNLYAEKTAGRRGSWYYTSSRSCDYMVSRAAMNGISSLRDLLPAMETEILETQGSDGTWGDELSTAMALCSLNHMGIRHVKTERGRAALLEMQRTDGSWGRSAFYAGPEPPSPHSAWFGSEELTASFCIEALSTPE